MSNNKYFQDIKINVEEKSDTQAIFTSEPFERGYAVTVGNSLRRTLLTSLPGVAITSLKIDGISHEFTAIEGISEDLSDIILNLKKVRFKLNEEANSELINFELQGPCKVTAKNLADNLSEFTVINKKV